MVNDQGLNNDIDQPEALDDRLFQLGLDQSLLCDQLSLPGVQLSVLADQASLADHQVSLPDDHLSLPGDQPSLWGPDQTP